MVFLEILQNSQENTCPRVSFLIKFQASGFKKETLTQVFSCEFCEISTNTFFTEHLHSVHWGINPALKNTNPLFLTKPGAVNKDYLGIPLVAYLMTPEAPQLWAQRSKKNFEICPSRRLENAFSIWTPDLKWINEVFVYF